MTKGAKNVTVSGVSCFPRSWMSLLLPDVIDKTILLKNKTSANKSNSPRPTGYSISGHEDPSGKETRGSLCGRWSCLCRS